MIQGKLLSASFSSENYWKERYKNGGNSGRGSYGKFAEFKANILNEFINSHNIKSIIEYGCGDGNQLKLAKYPSYLGFDISPVAISMCRNIFPSDSSKSFKLMNEYNGETAELTLSLDVIYHLIEDDVFELYMKRLFDSSKRFVIIYSNNTDKQEKDLAKHVKYRKFTKWIEENEPQYKLIQCIQTKYPCNGTNYEGNSISNFYIYESFEICGP
jgi:hypothetical protein